MDGRPGLFDLITRNIPTSLISKKWMSQAIAIASQFPPWYTTSVMFEFYLHPEKTKGDFFVGMNNSYFLPLYNSYNKIPGDLKTVDTSFSQAVPAQWKWIRDFFRHRENKPLPFYEKIEEIYFEFDTSKLKEEIPRPLLFLKYKETSGDFADKAFLPLTENIEKFNQTPVTPKMKKNIKAFLQLIPDECRLFGIGFLSERKSRAVRLCVLSSSFEPLISIIKKTSLGKYARELEKIAAPVVPFFDHYALAVNLDDTIPPLIGLELYPGMNEYTVQRKELCKPALEHFTRLGLCPADKAKALLASHFRERNIFDPFMVKVMTASSMSHFKIVYEPGLPALLKAYLNVSFLPVIS